jgi:hypothetical protein
MLKSGKSGYESQTTTEQATSRFAVLCHPMSFRGLRLRFAV